MLFSIVYEFGFKMYINEHNELEDVLENRKLVLITKM